MKNPFLLLVGVVLAVFNPARASGQSTAEELRNSLRDAEAAFARAFAERDLEKFLSFIDEDAMFLGSQASQRGKAAVREVWAAYFEADRAPFSWAPERYEVNPSGTMGMTTGPVRGPEGQWVTSFMSVWKLQEDGTWRIIFDGAPRCPCQKDR